MPAAFALRMPSMARSKLPGRPRNSSCVSRAPSSDTPTYESPTSAKRAASSGVMSVPFVDRTTRMPRSFACCMSSTTSSRMHGSPPENSSTGAPNADRSSIMAFASPEDISPS